MRILQWIYVTWPGMLAAFFFLISAMLWGPVGLVGAEDYSGAGRVNDDRVIFLPLVLLNSSTTQPVQLVPGLPFNPLETRSGEGTYYAATGAGNCSFAASPDDLMVAAVNWPDYTNAWLCGAYIEVNGPDGRVVVRVVDSCPSCATGDIDLSREAFARIADPVRGRVPISWKVVSPVISGSIVYQFKDGSNPYWTAVQIRNHRNPVHSLEYRASDGTFKPAGRVDYNYFIETSGMGSGPFTFRVTDIYGNVLTDSGIPFVENGEVQGSGQFPAR